jgi:hypothetical protein
MMQVEKLIRCNKTVRVKANEEMVRNLTLTMHPYLIILDFSLNIHLQLLLKMVYRLLNKFYHSFNLNILLQ